MIRAARIFNRRQAHFLPTSARFFNHRQLVGGTCKPPASDLNRQTFRLINTSEPARHVCATTEVLKTSDCPPDAKPVIDSCKQRAARDICKDANKRKTVAADGGDSSGGGHAGKDGDSNYKWKCALAVLAALGTGGLLTYFLTRPGKKDKSTQQAVADNTETTQATVPPSSSMLPKQVPYLIIGGGASAMAAFRSIKINDMRAKVLMLTKELQYPYNRPPLSKELWYYSEVDPGKDYIFKGWSGEERSLYIEPKEFYLPIDNWQSSVNGGISVAQGFEVKKIDPVKRVVTLADGYEIEYEQCLLATGSTPKMLPIFASAPPSVREKVMTYHTPEDFDRLRQYALEKRTITVVGNGFTGSELANSLAFYGKDGSGAKVYQIFEESSILSKFLPDYLARWATLRMEEYGVCVIPNASIKSATRDESQLKLELNNGKTLLTDIVVLCVGNSPNTQLAATSQLEVDRHIGGFIVNAELETSGSLYAAGDACCFVDPLLGRRRVEHHDHAIISGRIAGENMTGKKKSYAHRSHFWSDFGPATAFEAVGLIDSSLPTVGVFALASKGDSRTGSNLTEGKATEEAVPPEELPKADVPDVRCDPAESDNYGKGVIFYLNGDKIVGILMWNIFGRIGLARTIINQDKVYEDLNEVAKLFQVTS